MNTNLNLKGEKPNDNIGFLLWQTQMQWQKEMNNALRQIELTHTQFIVLIGSAWLTREGENITQKEIANHLNIDRMMVSKILRTLQKNGLIDRKEHPKDTRAKCVDLTDKGREALKKAIHIKTTANTTFFKSLKDKKQFMQELRNLTGINKP